MWVVRSVLLLSGLRYKYLEGTGFRFHLLGEPDWEETGAYWWEIFQKQRMMSSERGVMSKMTDV